MQKLLLLLFLVAATTASAQIQRGDRLISTGTTGTFTFPTPPPAAGAGVDYGIGEDHLSAQFGATYGYAVLDRLMLGTGVSGYFYLAEESQSTLNLSPFLRYYLLNREKLQVFGQIGSQLVRGDENFTAFDQLNLSAGVQLPLAPDVFFTPRLNYAITEGRNSLGLQAAIEIRLRTREEADRPVGSLRAGRVMLGAESISLGGRRNVVSAGARLGGHYFVTDRLALGTELGGGFLKFEPLASGQDFSSSSLNLGASVRYYLNNDAHTLWFVEGGLGRAWQRQRDQGMDAFTVSRTLASVGGGAQIFLRERVSLEVAPRLSYDFRTERTSLGASFGVRFGL